MVIASRSFPVCCHIHVHCSDFKPCFRHFCENTFYYYIVLSSDCQGKSYNSFTKAAAAPAFCLVFLLHFVYAFAKCGDFSDKILQSVYRRERRQTPFCSACRRCSVSITIPGNRFLSLRFPVPAAAECGPAHCCSAGWTAADG